MYQIFLNRLWLSTIFAARLTKGPKILKEFARPQDRRLVLPRSQFVGVYYSFVLLQLFQHTAPRATACWNTKYHKKHFLFHVTSLRN